MALPQDPMEPLVALLFFSVTAGPVIGFFIYIIINAPN